MQSERGSPGLTCRNRSNQLCTCLAFCEEEVRDPFSSIEDDVIVYLENLYLEISILSVSFPFLHTASILLPIMSSSVFFKLQRYLLFMPVVLHIVRANIVITFIRSWCMFWGCLDASNRIKENGVRFCGIYWRLRDCGICICISCLRDSLPTVNRLWSIRFY